MEQRERGTLWLVNIYARAHVRLVPEMLVIFGDNIQEEGMGGQAAQCRGEPNAFGIPVKWAPARTPNAFFDDGDIIQVGRLITGKFQDVRDRLLHGKDVAYPFSGIGTGLARLESTAPKIMSLVHSGESMLKESAKEVLRVNNLSIAWGHKKVENL